jgi:hypothetical protein
MRKAILFAPMAALVIGVLAAPVDLVGTPGITRS